MGCSETWVGGAVRFRSEFMRAQDIASEDEFHMNVG